MKKTIYLAFAALALSAMSCSKDTFEKTSSLVSATITAESSDSKTTAERYQDQDSQEYMYHIFWSEGDCLGVFNDKESTSRKFTTSDEGRRASFTGEIPAGANITRAILPYCEKASIEGDVIMTNIPKDQDGTFTNIVLASTEDAVSYGEGISMGFVAVSGILKFSFDPEKIAGGKVVKQINISSAERPIAGDAKITFSETGDPVMEAAPNKLGSNVYNSISITKSEGFTKGDYYVATFPIYPTEDLPKIKIVFRITTDDGEVRYVHSPIPNEAGKKHIFSANIVKNLSTLKVVEYEPQPFTSGEFTVGYNKKITFSRGNLQYQAATNKWRFANNQWDAMGDIGNLTPPTSSSDEGLRATQSEWIDLFPWGHSGWTMASAPHSFYPYTSITESGSMNYCSYNSGSNSLLGAYQNGDWGKFCDIYNGEQLDSAGTWRLLSAEEWKYMLGYSAPDPGAPGQVKPGRIAKVNKITDGIYSRYLFFMRCGLKLGVFDEKSNEIIRYGLVVFPDGFEWPDNVAKPIIKKWPYLAISWEGCDNESAPKYDVSELSKLEALGCVFLPCTAFRPGFSGNLEDPFSFANMGPNNSQVAFDYFFNNYGRYWTCDSPNGEKSQFVFYPANVSFETAFVKVGAESVRLVKDVVPAE